MFDIIMIVFDISLIMYFYNFAINTTDLGARLLACVAMTMEIFFIRKHFALVKYNLKRKNNNDTK